MKRLINNFLLNWKNDKNRKPLIVYGARQVGKTYSIVEFGKENYSNVIYLNFEGNNNLTNIFNKDLDPKRIILELEALYNQKILEEQTLIIFDEVQDCESALTSLKYFNEQANKYHIIAAGSLLGLALNREKFSFPVGKVNIVTMYPLNFKEFLMAFEREDLINMIRNSYNNDSPLSDEIHNLLLDYYYKYLIIGGMPAVVNAYIQNNFDFDYVKISQNEILSNYYGDMNKYTNINESSKIISVYRSIPSQLAKENKKFQYKLVGSYARASAYEHALEWLNISGIIYKCNKTNHGYYPIKSYQDLLSYKIYMNDIGLLSFSLNISYQSLLINNLSSLTKGAISENYVMQQLVSIGYEPFYWESNGRAEIDFIIQTNDQIIPIECKAADNTQSKSLKVYNEKYKPNYLIRTSTKNFGFKNNIKSIPLYAIFCLKN